MHREVSIGKIGKEWDVVGNGLTLRGNRWVGCTLSGFLGGIF